MKVNPVLCLLKSSTETNQRNALANKPKHLKYKHSLMLAIFLTICMNSCKTVAMTVVNPVMCQ